MAMTRSANVRCAKTRALKRLNVKQRGPKKRARNARKTNRRQANQEPVVAQQPARVLSERDQEILAKINSMIAKMPKKLPKNRLSATRVLLQFAVDELEKTQEKIKQCRDEVHRMAFERVEGIRVDADCIEHFDDLREAAELTLEEVRRVPNALQEDISHAEGIVREMEEACRNAYQKYEADCELMNEPLALVARVDQMHKDAALLALGAKRTLEFHLNTSKKRKAKPKKMLSRLRKENSKYTTELQGMLTDLANLQEVHEEKLRNQNALQKKVRAMTLKMGRAFRALDRAISEEWSLMPTYIITSDPPYPDPAPAFRAMDAAKLVTAAFFKNRDKVKEESVHILVQCAKAEIEANKAHDKLVERAKVVLEKLLVEDEAIEMKMELPGTYDIGEEEAASEPPKMEIIGKEEGGAEIKIEPPEIDPVQLQE